MLSDMPHHHPKWMPLSLHYAIERCLLDPLYALAELSGDGVLGFSRRVRLLPNLIGGINCGFKLCCVAWRLKFDVLDAAHSLEELRFLDENSYIPCPKCMGDEIG